MSDLHLPERKGFTIVHAHQEGSECVFGGPHVCEYRPTLRNRISAWLRSRGW